MGVSALADGECQTPVFESEGPSDRDGKLAVCGALGELAEHVIAQRGVLADAAANAERGGGGEVADGEDAARIAADNLDEVGQDAADRRGIQD